MANVVFLGKVESAEFVIARAGCEFGLQNDILKRMAIWKPSWDFMMSSLCFQGGPGIRLDCVVVAMVVGFRYMSDVQYPSGNADRHAAFRRFGTYSGFADADAALRKYWWSRTPDERMEALEELRIRVCGQEAIDARVLPIFGAIERPRR